MKICIATGAYAPYNIGGGEASAKQLAEGLVASGYDVVVLTIDYSDKEEIIDGVRVVRIEPTNFYWGTVDAHKNSGLMKALWHLRESYNITLENKLRKFFITENPDILHVRNITDMSPYIWKVGKKHGVKVVTTLNNYASLCNKVSMYNKGKNCEKQCFSCKLTSIPKISLSKYVDGVVSVSKFTLKRHTDLGFFQKSLKQIIYTQVDANFSDLPFFQNKYKIYGFIGRIEASKGVYEIIQNFISINTNSKLYIAGDGNRTYLDKCKKISNNNIIFLGKVNPNEFYTKVDIVVINSLWHEPFPRVLVESYSYGRPVLATKYGGTNELVHDGKTGFIYDPEHTSLSKEFIKLEQLSLSELENIRKNIFNLISKFRKSIVDQHIQLYTNLIEN